MSEWWQQRFTLYCEGRDTGQPHDRVDLWTRAVDLSQKLIEFPTAYAHMDTVDLDVLRRIGGGLWLGAYGERQRILHRAFQAFQDAGREIPEGAVGQAEQRTLHEVHTCPACTAQLRLTKVDHSEVVADFLEAGHLDVELALFRLRYRQSTPRASRSVPPGPDSPGCLCGRRYLSVEFIDVMWTGAVGMRWCLLRTPRKCVTRREDEQPVGSNPMQ